ncbi:MAG: FkbM family methyltransferase [Verrucomicrobiota bacterium]
MSEEFNQLTDSRHGRMIYNRNDMYIGRSLEVYGEFSHGEAVIFKQIVQPGFFVIEAGANIGAHTVVLAKRAGAQGRVLAFEPQRIVFQTMCGNVALNNLRNVYTYNAGLGEESGELVVPDLDPTSENNFGGLGLGDYTRGLPVPIHTIDSFDLPRCDFIKADVEGMEENVLRGGEETIIKFQPTLYIENDREDKAPSLVGYIRSLGYRIYFHSPFLYNENNFRKNADNIYPGVVSKNILCVHESRGGTIKGLPEYVPAEVAEARRKEKQAAELSR